jgi:hypothetical protein
MRKCVRYITIKINTIMLFKMHKKKLGKMLRSSIKREKHKVKIFVFLNNILVYGFWEMERQAM